MMSTHLPSPNKTYETFNMDWDYAFESPFPLPAEMWDDSNAQPRTLPFTNSDALMLGFSLDHLVHDDAQDDIVDTLGRLETGGSTDDELMDSLSSYEEPTALRVSIPSCNNAPLVGLPTPKATPVAAETPDCAATADNVLKAKHATSTSTRIPSPSPPPISLPTPVEEGGSPHTPDLTSDDDQTPPATHPATPSPQEVCDVVVKQEILDDHFAKQDIGPAVDTNPPCSPPASPLATAPALSKPCHAPISPRLANKETAADNTPSSNSDTARSSPLLTSSSTPVMTAAENPPMEALPCSPPSCPQFTVPPTTQPETGPEPDAEEDASSAGVDASASSSSPECAPDGSTIPTAAPAAATTTLPMVSPRCTQVTPLTSTPMDETQLALAPKSEPEPRQPERGQSEPVTTTPTTPRSSAREPTITATDSATTAAPTTGSAGNGLEPAISASGQPASTKLANDNTGGNSTLDCPVTAVDGAGPEQTKDQALSLPTSYNVPSNEAMEETVADLRRTEAVVAAQPGSRVEVAGEVGVPLTPLPTAVDTQDAQKTPSPHTVPRKRHALRRVKLMFYKEELLLNEPLAPNQQTTELPDDVVTSTGQVLQPAEPLPIPTVSEANSSDAASPSDPDSSATVAPSERPPNALQLLCAYKSPTPSMTDDENVPPIHAELPLPGPHQHATAPDAAQVSLQGAGQTSGPVTSQKLEPSDTQDPPQSSSPSVSVPAADLGSTEAVSSSSPTSTPSLPSTTMEGVARPGATPDVDACGLPTLPLTAKYATFPSVTLPSDGADIHPPVVVEEASPMENPAASPSAKCDVASPEAHMSTASTPTSEALLTPFGIKHDMTTNRFDTVTTPSDCQPIELPLSIGWTCPPVSMVRGTFNDADESTTADDLPADSKGDAQLDGRLALDVSNPAAEQELVATTPASGKSPKKAPSKGPGKWELKNLLSQSVSFMSFDQHSSGSRRLPATKYWTPSIGTSEPTPLSPKKNASTKTKKQPSTSRRRRASSASQNAVMEAATVALKKNNAAGCSVEAVTENDEANDAQAPSDSLPPHNPAPMPKRSDTSGQIPPSFMVALAEPSSPVVEQPIPSSALRARARPKRPQQSRTAPTPQTGSPQTASPAMETLHLPSTSSPETGSPLTPPPPSPRRSVKRKLDDLDPQTESVNDGPTKKKASSRSYCEAEDAIIHRFFPFSDSSSPPARAAANECIKELKSQGYPHRSTDALLYRVRTSIWKTSIRRKH